MKKEKIGFSKAAKSIRLGSFRHYKGGEYDVIAIAHLEDTLQEVVVYRSNLDGSVWVRTVQNFKAKVKVGSKSVPRFKKITYNNNTAVALLFDPVRKEVLLQKRTKDAKVCPNHWGFFGGIGEGREQPTKTLQREVLEETGIDVKKLPIKFFRKRKNQYGKLVYCYIINCDKSKIKVALGEGAGYGWVKADKVLKLKLTPSIKHFLEEFFKNEYKRY